MILRANNYELRSEAYWLVVSIHQSETNFNLMKLDVQLCRPIKSIFLVLTLGSGFGFSTFVKAAIFPFLFTVSQLPPSRPGSLKNISFKGRTIISGSYPHTRTESIVSYNQFSSILCLYVSN